jgi:hypothetical protein
MRVYVNVVCVYFVPVSLLLIDQHGLVNFFVYRPLLAIGCRIVQILRQRRRKTTNTAPTTLTGIQAASQSTFVNTQLYVLHLRLAGVAKSPADH